MSESFLSITTTTTEPGVFLSFSAAGSPGPVLSLTGTASDPLYQQPGLIIPGTPPGPGETNEPPRPPYLTPTPGTFNHLTLPRLQAQPSKVFNLAIFSISLTIAGLDFSPSIKSLDWSTPLNGVAQGSILLVNVAGINLNPDTNGITQGTPVEITYKPTSTTETLLARCYVIGNPKYYLNGEGTYQLALEIGDELALLSNTTRNRGLYCGLPPKNVGEFANIYASLNGLRTRSFPVGHDLIESTFNNFYTESPHDILSRLYAATNRDVRTNPNGLIICPPRTPYTEATAKEISYTDVIESEPSYSQLFEPFTRVKASNNYRVAQPFVLSKRTFTKVNGDPQNRKPWFQGGYQETVTTITSYGDTDIHILEEVRGYVPIEARPWDAALVDQDPCAIGSFTTTLDVINRKIKALQYYAQGDAFIVSKEETWENGLLTYKIEGGPNDGKTDLFNGLISYQAITYQITPQPSTLVCQKDYIQVVTRQRVENYALDDDRLFRFNSWIEELYTPSGISSTLGQTSFTGVEQTWSKTTNQGERQSNTDTWVIQPTRVETGVNPPSATYIKPSTVDVVNFSEYQLPGSPTTGLEPIPLSAPFCYDTGHLNTVSDRYLREQYGLSKSRVITTPVTFPLALGESVKFTDRSGHITRYTVWTMEHNLTLKDMTKTYILLRHYE